MHHFRCILSGIDNSLIVYLYFFSVCAMYKHIVYVCPGIGSCENKTYFTNKSMKNISSILNKSICINRKLLNIAMLKHFFCILGSLCFIEETIAINAISTIFKKSVPKNVSGIIMLMIPHKRNCHTVAILESIFSYGSTI